MSILVILGQYCPLTLWENTLRAKYDPSLVYTGSCIIHYVQKLLYPDINPLIIRAVTTFIAIFSIVVFIVKPPIHKGWTFLFHLKEGSNKNKENI